MLIRSDRRERHRRLLGFQSVPLRPHPEVATSADSFSPAVHVFETSERSRTAHYKVTSTVLLDMSQGVAGAGEGAKAGEVALGGSMTRQVSWETCECRQGGLS